MPNCHMIRGQSDNILLILGRNLSSKHMIIHCPHFQATESGERWSEPEVSGSPGRDPEQQG